MAENSYTISYNPFRINYQSFKFKSNSKVRKNLKGKYNCEIENCPARAEIDKRGNFQTVPGFEKHHNHHLVFPGKLIPYYQTIQYTILEKPFRILADGERFMPENPVELNTIKNISGFYRCESSHCPVKAHIDADRKFRYLNAEEYHGNCPQHKNHPMQESYQCNFSVTKKPFRLHYQDQKFVKKGKLRDNFNGVYRCEDKNCQVHVKVVGNYVYWLRYGRCFKYNCMKAHTRHR
jgi:hypothetical protein